MIEIQEKANSTLLLIYELTDGKLYETVLPTELVERQTDAPKQPKTIEELIIAIEPLGFLWLVGMIELTQRTILLTEKGKEHIEKMVKDFKESIDEKLKNFADEVSDEIH